MDKVDFSPLDKLEDPLKEQLVRALDNITLDLYQEAGFVSNLPKNAEKIVKKLIEEQAEILCKRYQNDINARLAIHLVLNLQRKRLAERLNIAITKNQFLNYVKPLKR